jgi:hypothetical protein
LRTFARVAVAVFFGTTEAESGKSTEIDGAVPPCFFEQRVRLHATTRSGHDRFRTGERDVNNGRFVAVRAASIAASCVVMVSWPRSASALL